jgi:hypothetical protein
MNMKKLALIAVLGALALFTACGDDESSSESSCTYKDGSLTICEQGPAYEGDEEDCLAEGGKFDSSCETEDAVECKIDGSSVFFYGKDIDQSMCELLTTP